MKTAITILSALVSGAVLAQSVPKPPTQLCIDDQCVSAPEPIVGKYETNTSFEYPAMSACGDISDITYKMLDGFQLRANIDGGARTCISISTERALSGTKSLKTVLTRDSAADYRSEFQAVGYPRHDGYAPEAQYVNRDHWYGVAVYIPNGYVASASRDIVIQWHTFSWLENPKEVTTSPLNSIQIRNNQWQIVRRWNPNKESTISTMQQAITTLPGSIVTGAWQRWVCRIRWHWIDGQTQCWLNDKEVYKVNGGNMSNDTNPPYGPLLGNYRVGNKQDAGEPGVSPRILYFDNMKVMLSGGSYNAVRP